MVKTLNNIAMAIYTAYRQELGLVGGSYERGPEHDTRTWTRCANLVSEMGFEPKKFVQAQFNATSKNARKTLRPQHLYRSRDRSVKNYAKLLSVSDGMEDKLEDEDPNARVRAHLASMECSLSRLSKRLVPNRFASEEAILMEATMPFTAWFRVLVSPSLPEALAERYLEEAKLQVLQDIPLRTLLKEEYVTERYAARRLLV